MACIWMGVGSTHVDSSMLRSSTCLICSSAKPPPRTSNQAPGRRFHQPRHERGGRRACEHSYRHPYRRSWRRRAARRRRRCGCASSGGKPAPRPPHSDCTRPQPPEDTTRPVSATGWKMKRRDQSRRPLVCSPDMAVGVVIAPSLIVVLHHLLPRLLPPGKHLHYPAILLVRTGVACLPLALLALLLLRAVSTLALMIILGLRGFRARSILSGSYLPWPLVSVSTRRHRAAEEV